MMNCLLIGSHHSMQHSFLPLQWYQTLEFIICIQLMSRESSLFLDFVKISTILCLTIIMQLLIPEVLMIILSYILLFSM